MRVQGAIEAAAPSSALRALGWCAVLALLGRPLPATAAGDWTITPSISGQELFTDNVLLTPTNPRMDFVTTIAPRLNIQGESARLTGVLDYSPSAYLYANTPQQDVVGQNLYANGTATLIRDLFFFDARGYASLQPTTPGLVTGGFGPNFSPTGIGTGPSAILPRTQLTQVTSFSASPYLMRRFGTFGTGELRYTVSTTDFSGGQNTPITQPGFAVQNTSSVTNEGTAAFLTGGYFGPFESRIVLDTARSTGTGVLNNASQDSAVADSAYAITRRIFALGTIGWEHLRFGGFPPTRIDDAIWGMGARFTPRPDATVTFTYGHRYGFSAPYFSLDYAITARTRVNASYSEGLTTVNEAIANDLAVSALNASGQTVNVGTLLPIAIGNPTLGLQSGLFRTRRFQGVGYLDFPRDHFALTAYHEEDLIVSQSTVGAGISQRVTGGNANWARDLNPLTTANFNIGYADFSFPAQPNSQEGLLTTSLSLTYLLNSTLTSWAGWAYLHRTSPTPQLRLSSNVIFIGISKAF